MDSNAAVGVYRTGHIVRLTEALGETFEAVWWVAGDEHYFQLAKEFLLAHPSASYNLSDFGISFPNFLDKRQPFSDLPFLADLARFEWLFKEVFHLPPHTGLTPEQFQEPTLSGNVAFDLWPFHPAYFNRRIQSMKFGNFEEPSKIHCQRRIGENLNGSSPINLNNKSILNS